MQFTNHQPLADYFDALLQTVASHSFLVSATDSTVQHPPLTITWPSSNRSSSPIDSTSPISEFKAIAHDSFDSLTRTWNAKPAHHLCSALPAPSPSSSLASQVYDTSIRPVLQMGPFSISQETDLVVPTIFRTGNSLATAPGGAGTTIDWTSGYFSVQEAYRERVLDSRAIVRIVAASPEVSQFLSHAVLSPVPRTLLMRNES